MVPGGNQMVDERTFLLVDLYQLKKVEGMIHSKTHHCAPTTMNELDSHWYSHHRKMDEHHTKTDRMSLLMKDGGTTHEVVLLRTQT